jgi:hypothetical protein
MREKMSLDTALARMATLNAFLAGPTAPATTAPATATTTAGTASTDDFATMLRSAAVTGTAPVATGTRAAGAVAPVAAPAGNSPAARMVAMAQAEVGQAEQPPGSNNSPRIAQYRSATAGAPGPGPWCAYFTSWLARGAGVPVGDHGQGFGSVDALYAWAQKSGRAIPTSSGQDPKPGDLIVWDEHIGIVESVRPDGSIQTIEGNSSDRVSRRVHQKGDALGYVRLSN